MHAGVWSVIERCWAADPTARPAAAWVLQQLQQLLQAEEAAAAQAALQKSNSGVARVLSRLRSASSRRSIESRGSGKIEESGDSTVAVQHTNPPAALAAAAYESMADSSAAAAVADSAGASGASGDGKAVVVAAVACNSALQDKALPAVCAAAGRGTAAGRDRHGSKVEPACGCVIC
jgi:hypothetical protein